jgi:hypothetical protein
MKVPKSVTQKKKGAKKFEKEKLKLKVRDDKNMDTEYSMSSFNDE